MQFLQLILQTTSILFHISGPTGQFPNVPESTTTEIYGELPNVTDAPNSENSWTFMASSYVTYLQN